MLYCLLASAPRRIFRHQTSSHKAGSIQNKNPSFNDDISIKY